MHAKNPSALRKLANSLRATVNGCTWPVKVKRMQLAASNKNIHGYAVTFFLILARSLANFYVSIAQIPKLMGGPLRFLQTWLSVQGSQPVAVQIKARAKWDSWNGVKGNSKQAAEEEYIPLVKKLQAEQK
eukprot:g35075.t1